MVNIYLIAAAHCLRHGCKRQALVMLGAALAECNRDLECKLTKRHVMRAISFARRT